MSVNIPMNSANTIPENEQNNAIAAIVFMLKPTSEHHQDGFRLP